MGDLVLTGTRGDVMVITLNNPARRNVLDPEMTAALHRAVNAASGAAAVALLAEGDHFCVGGDVAAFGAAADPGDYVSSLAQAFHGVVRALRACPVPVVAGHRGWAAGAGMSILLAADLVVSGSSASMRPAYPGIGVTPDGGMTWTLPRLVGEKRALAILLRNSAIAVDEAQRLGLVTEVVEDAAVDERVIEVAGELAASAAGSLIGMKRLVRDGATRTLSDHLDAEAASIAACAGSPEGREGVEAFLERREPDFRSARRR